MKILIGAGGTGGHIYPGLAIANTIKEKHPDWEIRFVGTSNGMETAIVPAAGYKLETIRVKGFERKLSLGTIRSFKELIHGMGDARKLLKTFAPDLVIGMGGYVCGPLLLSASRMDIPTMIHEQNAFPGATNRLLAGFVDRIGVSFPQAKERFRHAEKVFICGNPVRKSFFSGEKQKMRDQHGYGKDDFVVVSSGGSLGAATINDAVLYWMVHPPKNPNIRLIHITGKRRFDAFYQDMMDRGIESDTENWFKVLSYTDNMDEIMALADVAVSRSGAMSVAEITASKTPAILIPYPHATGNHQEFNARTITDHGGGVLMLDSTLKESPQLLKNQLEHWADHSEELSSMEEKVGKLARERADEIFYEEIIHLLESKNGH